MPTVERLGGFRVVIYTNDHRPEHVHVIGNDREAVFELRCPEGPPALRENYGLSRPEVSRIAAALATRLAYLCAEWSSIHGNP